MSVFFLNMNIARSPFVSVASCRRNIGVRGPHRTARRDHISIRRRRRGDHAGASARREKNRRDLGSRRHLR
jgi:hypothetical protein